jgi:hypothetical protein
MQQWAWADLLDMVMPEALEATSLSETYSSLRQGLPRGFMDYMGAMYEEPSDEKMPDSLKKVAAEDEQAKYRKILQEHFRAEAKKRIMKVAKAVRLSLLIMCVLQSASHISPRFCRPMKWWMLLVIKWPSDTCQNASLRL